MAKELQVKDFKQFYNFSLLQFKRWSEEVLQVHTEWDKMEAIPFALSQVAWDWACGELYSESRQHGERQQSLLKEISKGVKTKPRGS